MRTGSLVLAATLVAFGLTAVSAATSPQAALATPTVSFTGDPTFDSDSIATDDATQPRWDSMPGSRWGMGIYGGSSIDGVLGMQMGGYVADGPKTLSSIVADGLGPHLGATTGATSAGSKWYPYKLTFHGEWSSYGNISGTDFFADKNSVVRQLHVTPLGSPDVTFAGSVPSSAGVAWDATHKALFVGTANWGYALTFYQGSVPTAITITPTWNSTTWSVVQNVTSSTDLYVSIGFWAGSETAQSGLTRSQNAVSTAAATTIAVDKSAMDALLRSVPAPTQWGIAGVNDIGTSSGREVTPAVQKAKYYRAWAFAVQQPIDQQADFTAAGVGYPLIAAGKPTLNSGFNTQIPSMDASDPWDSLFGIQLLAYVPSERAEAISALRGILALNVQGTNFYGERLPSRVAQTAWILYQETGDLTMLNSLYTPLRAYLDYMEGHFLYGLNGSEPFPNEKDIEYVASWLFDVGFMKKIAAALGEPSAETSHWNTESSSQLTNLRTWFFPGSVDTTCGGSVHSFSIGTAGAHCSFDSSGNPVQFNNSLSILSALAIPDLPQDIHDQLVQYLIIGHEPTRNIQGIVVPEYNAFDPTIAGAGIGYTKYPDSSMIALGLIGTVGGPVAFQYVNTLARDAAYAANFSEYLAPGDGLAVTNGQMTSLFSASQLIDATLLLNGYSFGEGGEVLARPAHGVFYSGFEPGDTALTAADTPTGPGVSGVSGICCGATGPLTTVVGGAGRSGQNALFFSGGATGTGHDFAYTKVFDLASPLTVSAGTMLQYSIYPDSSADSSNVTGNASAFVAVDLVFNDGTRLSSYGAVDQHGDLMTPQGQGAGGHHQLHAWNRVMAVVPSSTVGKTITQVILGYDETGGPNGGYAGFVDDLSIADGYFG